jgi:hypothetical protein
VLLSRAQEEPVFVQSRCGRDRDCIPDDRIVASYQVAYNGSLAWNRLGSGRYVDIFSEPGRALLAHLQGSDNDAVVFTPNTRDELEMRAIQHTPNAGRFGWLLG